MLFSWLRSALKAPHNRRPARRPATFRPTLECLDSRICPTSPHFIGSAQASLTSTAEVVVTFKEAGLGTNQNIDYLLTADASGQYQWFNHGGNKPQGQPFQFGPITVSATGTFSSGQNGNVVGSLTVSPPPPSAEVLAAGNGKNWTLQVTITYSNITLTDTTNGVIATVTPTTLGPTTVVVPT
jgi:hypothetical protein